MTTEFTIRLRNCDILPEIERKTGSSTHPVSDAINEVLLIPPSLVTWTVKDSMNDEEDDFSTFELEGHSTNLETIVKQKIAFYNELRGIALPDDEPDDELELE